MVQSPLSPSVQFAAQRLWLSKDAVFSPRPSYEASQNQDPRTSLQQLRSVQGVARVPRKPCAKLSFTIREFVVFVGMIAIVLVWPPFIYPAFAMLLIYVLRGYTFTPTITMIVMIVCGIVGAILGVAMAVIRR